MIIDYLSNLPKYAKVLPNYEQYAELLLSIDQLSLGRHEINEFDFINIIEGETVSMDEGYFEFHQNYLDIQIVLEGEEYMQWQNIHQLQPAIDYDEVSDIGFLKGIGDTLHIEKGMFYIVYPEDAHKPGRHIDEVCQFKKAVVKVRV